MLPVLAKPSFLKIVHVLVIVPLLLSPILAVEFPRILAYTPLISIVFGAVFFLQGKDRPGVWPVYLMIAGLPLFFLWGVFNAFYVEEALERWIKLVMVFPAGALFLYILKAQAARVSRKFIDFLVIF